MAAPAKSRESRPSRWLALFFGVFALVGGIVWVALGVLPTVQVLRAQGWSEAECTMTRARVATNRSSDGDTYSLDVSYSYTWDGDIHIGDRYDFSVGSSSGYDGKARIAAELKPPTAVPCFVDPGDPTQSVLVRTPGAFLLLGWLFPAPFLAVGLGGAFWVLRPRGLRDVKPIEPTAAPAPAVEGPLELSPTGHPWGAVLFIALFALVWDGIVLCAGGSAWSDGDGYAIAFLSLFVLAGAGITLVLLPYTVLKATNPRPKIVLPKSRLAVGEEVSLLWSLDGSSKRLRALTVRLEGVESARYRRGTDTVTETHVFHDELLASLAEGDTPEGLVMLRIPEGTMHSFDAPNNKIIWRLRIEGDIPRWPDIDETFPLDVAAKRVQ